RLARQGGVRPATTEACDQQRDRRPAPDHTPQPRLHANVCRPRIPPNATARAIARAGRPPRARRPSHTTLPSIAITRRPPSSGISTTPVVRLGAITVSLNLLLPGPRCQREAIGPCGVGA